MVGLDLAGGHLEGGEQGGRAVPLVGRAVAEKRAAGGQSEVALGALEGLDVRLLVDGEHDGVLGRVEIEPDDRRRLGRELGIRALAPAVRAAERDLVGAQNPPHLMVRDIAQLRGQQWPCPARQAGRRWCVQQGQNPALRGRPITRRGTRPRPVRQPLKTAFGIADAPTATRPGHVPSPCAIERVERPSAANNTIRARSARRCSVFGERTRLSSRARPSSVKWMGVASRVIPILNHDSNSDASEY